MPSNSPGWKTGIVKEQIRVWDMFSARSGRRKASL
jgi:hypothetical protein